jgi:hypothetical protein
MSRRYGAYLQSAGQETLAAGSLLLYFRFIAPGKNNK